MYHQYPEFSEQQVAHIMQETRMDRMQAINHLRARKQVRDMYEANHLAEVQRATAAWASRPAANAS